MALIVNILKFFWRLPRVCLIKLIRFYQLAISPILPPTCKYQPSCSTYGIEALRKHGAFRGSLKTAWRIVRCNPFSKGGVDPP